MRLGLNTTFFISVPHLDGDMQLRVWNDINSLYCRHLRIPINWRHLEKVEGEGDNFKWNEANLLKYKKFLKCLPEECDILAVVLSAPIKYAVDYYYDQSSISERFVRFVSKVSEVFPEISSWEIWNEPNASDFYLSIKTDSGHRPQTPAEYIRDILIPGAKEIRKLRPNDKICAAGLAENGIVGHTDRPPALANQLPIDKYFAPMRSKKPHGQLYFCPNYLYDYLDNLECAITSEPLIQGRPILDALAFHPYPYFQIMKEGELNLAKRSISLSSRFILELSKRKGLNTLECWITEVGARSFVLPKQHYFDEYQQDDFFNEFYQWCQGTAIRRMYWYKYMDQDWEMTQEKTFGLINNLGERKVVFFSFQEKCSQHKYRWKYISESFERGHLHRRGSFNEIFWEVTKSNIFAYDLVSRHKKEGQVCIVSPGRNKGSKWSAITKIPVWCDAGESLVFSCDYTMPQSNALFDLSIRLIDKDTKENVLNYTISRTEGDDIVFIFNNHRKIIRFHKDRLRKVIARDLSRVMIVYGNEDNKAFLKVGGEEICVKFPMASSLDGKNIILQIEIKAIRTIVKQPKPSYAMLGNICLYSK